MTRLFYDKRVKFNEGLKKVDDSKWIYNKISRLAKKKSSVNSRIPELTARILYYPNRITEAFIGVDVARDGMAR